MKREKLNMYCEDCKEYTGRITRWRYKKFTCRIKCADGTCRNVVGRENIACCKCQICQRSWRTTIDLTVLEKPDDIMFLPSCFLHPKQGE